MNGAALAIVSGLWVLAQVFRGQALQRLGIVGSGVASSSSATPSAPGAPDYNGPAGGVEGGATT